MRTDGEEHHVSFDIKCSLANSQIKYIQVCVLRYSGSSVTLKTSFWTILGYFLLGRTKGGNCTDYNFVLLSLVFCFVLLFIEELLWFLSCELCGGCPLPS